MAFRCAWCGSVETQPGLDEYTCFACGKQTKASGEKSPATVSAPGNPRVFADHAFLPNMPGPAVASEPAAAVVAPETADQQDVTPAAVPTPVVADHIEPAPIDLSELSPEQVAAIELIAHPEEMQ